jgi:hypothetical protein
MAIDINIPSQVKNYANLAAFPATGSLKTIYIAEDTNKTYRWTGSAYVEISASQAASWGTITGTLSSQTDLQNALNAKQDSLGFTPVPTTRTLTINGTTQDLSADRTFTISTGITIGTTAITSGTVGRVLFEGTGNVVSESANLFFDATNNRLGINTSTPTNPLSIYRSGSANYFNFEPSATGTAPYMQAVYQGAVDARIYFDSNSFKFRYAGSTSPFAIDCASITSNGNIVLTGSTEQKLHLFGSTNNYIQYTDAAAINIGVIGTADATSYIQVRTGNATNMSTGTLSTTFFNSGNVGIGGITTDAGFKVDINGTARVQNLLTLSNGSYSTAAIGWGAQIGFYYDASLGIVTNIGGVTISSVNGTRFNFDKAVGIGTFNMTNDASARLQINSTTQGVLFPRMTTTQKNAIASPAAGLMVYDTTLNLMALYNGTTWTTL